MITRMNLNDIDLVFLKQYLRIEEDFTEDDVELQLYLHTAIEYLLKYTGLNYDTLNESVGSVICCLMLVAHFYENKTITTTQQHLDKVFQSLMDIDRRWL